MAALTKLAEKRIRTPDWNAQSWGHHVPAPSDVPFASNYTLAAPNIGSISYNAAALTNANC